MSAFTAFLPRQSRAIIPQYVSQWRDKIITFNADIDPFIVAGYPYSRADIFRPRFDGLPDGTIIDFEGNPLITFQSEIIVEEQ